MALVSRLPAASNVHSLLPGMVARISGESAELQSLDRYYTGSQPLSYLSPEVQRAVQGRLRSLVINWPRLVVNSLEERIDVEGFRLSLDQPANDDLWRIWRANKLPIKSQMAHVDAFVHGRAYVTVWANENDPGTPQITVESGEQMTVDFGPNGEVLAAVKCWWHDDMAYSTLYLPDSIERYEAPQQRGSAAAAGWTLREAPIAHDLGQVPVVPILNRPRMTHPFGESEMTDVLPLVDAINKLATDMMVSAEYHAMPRRWATGMDLGGSQETVERTTEMVRQRWTEASAGRVWLSDDPQAHFGQFPEASLDNFVKGIEMLASQVAAISGLPPHYVGLMSQANPASADAIRSAEASLVERAKRKQRVLGEAWQDVIKLAILVRDGGPLPASMHSLETIWRDPETPTVAQKVDAAVKLDGIGMPLRQSLEDLGYTPTQIARVLKSRTVDSLADVTAQLGYVDEIIAKYGISRAAALAAVGLVEAATVEARVEARQPPTLEELAPPGSHEDPQLAAAAAAAVGAKTGQPTPPPPGVQSPNPKTGLMPGH